MVDHYIREGLLDLLDLCASRKIKCHIDHSQKDLEWHLAVKVDTDELRATGDLYSCMQEMRWQITKNYGVQWKKELARWVDLSSQRELRLEQEEWVKSYLDCNETTLENASVGGKWLQGWRVRDDEIARRIRFPAKIHSRDVWAIKEDKATVTPYGPKALEWVQQHWDQPIELMQHKITYFGDLRDSLVVSEGIEGLYAAEKREFAESHGFSANVSSSVRVDDLKCVASLKKLNRERDIYYCTERMVTYEGLDAQLVFTFSATTRYHELKWHLVLYPTSLRKPGRYSLKIPDKSLDDEDESDPRRGMLCGLSLSSTPTVVEVQQIGDHIWWSINGGPFTYILDLERKCVFHVTYCHYAGVLATGVKEGLEALNPRFRSYEYLHRKFTEVVPKKRVYWTNLAGNQEGYVFATDQYDLQRKLRAAWPVVEMKIMLDDSPWDERWESIEDGTQVVLLGTITGKRTLEDRGEADAKRARH